jgi:hypothetical protein
LLEGVRVYFEWGLPEDLSSITDANGEAFMYYNSPNTIEEVGEYFAIPTPGDLTVTFTSQLIPEGTSMDEIWIFALRHTDEFFGLKNDSAVNTYYDNYLSDEDLPQTAAERTNEISYRKHYFPDLDNPDVRPIAIAGLNQGTGDLTKGQKRLVLKHETDSIFINPSTNVRADENLPVWWPVHPLTYAGGVLSYHLLDIPTGDADINSYFIVSNQKRRIRAYAINDSGEKVYSNYIAIKIKIPDSYNGTFYQSILQEPFISGLLLGDQGLPARADSHDLSTYWNPDGSYPPDSGTPSSPSFLQLPTPSAGGKIPVGFRIKTQGVTVASFLEQVTFINPHGLEKEPEPDPT